MDVCVCVYSVIVLSCVQVVALRRPDHSSKESYCLYKTDYETEEEAGAQQRALELLVNEWINETLFYTQEILGRTTRLRSLDATRTE
jgi:hypothetical protein